ncbi:MAG: hypothetical protein WBD87_00685 [Candidatus Acidiferrales bacterium]
MRYAAPFGQRTQDRRVKRALREGTQGKRKEAEPLPGEDVATKTKWHGEIPPAAGGFVAETAPQDDK